MNRPIAAEPAAPSRLPRVALVIHPHALAAQDVLESLASSPRGLTHADVKERLSQFGPNALPRAKPATMLAIFLRQFKSPLIYVLLAAAIVSLLLGDWSDAAFISAVLLINAVIGTWQEYAAERSAMALQNLVSQLACVLREGDPHDIDAEGLVPGDIVLLEPGAKVPADLRLLDEHNLTIDESLLTGEALPVAKNADTTLDRGAVLGERVNMTFAGTMVATGRAHAVVVATGLDTALGMIAAAVLERPVPKPPLVIRMEQFTNRIALAVGLAALLVGAVAFSRGASLTGR